MDAAQLIDGLLNRLFLDPVLRGAYPADTQGLVERFAGLAHQYPDDLATMAAPIDLLGVNYYTPIVVAARVGARGAPEFPGSDGVVFPDQGRPTTAMGWSIHPDGLLDLLTRLHHDYDGVPMMITENGAAFDDRVVDGQVRDDDRVDYLRGHLEAVRSAVAAGVALRGYLAWSLLDNFEWAYGYSKRFGLVHVDYATQRRTPKRSALWFRDVIAKRSLDR
jgi:beta-glucosidase